MPATEEIVLVPEASQATTLQLLRQLRTIGIVIVIELFLILAALG